ncbi:hypothetical protein, partial [uncultured Paracoccus sp.]|uniref:hypothetical protein n=1 Tax=uncultured Paracoccus sp. TaxID=189685 RepID=UPI0025DDBD32
FTPFTLPLHGAAPNQTAQKQELEEGINRVARELDQSKADQSAVDAVAGEVDGKASIANGGRFFTSRSSAVSAGQPNLPTDARMLLVINGGRLEVRHPGNQVDDPLFDSHPYWGVAHRLANLSELAGKADQSAVDAVADEVAAKADQSDLDAETQARAEDVDRLTNDLDGKADARETDFPGVSWAVTLTYADGNNYRSWLEANDTDGGPSDWSATMMTDALRRNKAIAREVSFPGVSYGVVLRHGDDDDYRSWIEVNDEDGGPSEFALSILRERLGNIEPARPVDRMSDMGKIASWGASSMLFMRFALQDMADDLGAAYYSGGDGGTTADLSLARMGARPARLSFPGGVIPASGMTNVSCSLRYHTSIDPYPGVVAGVEGILSAPAGGSFVFERRIPGAAVPVVPDSPFVSTGGAPFSDGLHIINMGKNDLVSGDGAGLNDPARVMALTREAVDWIPTLNRRSLLLNHYVNRDVAPAAPERQRIADYNDMLAAAYGGIVIDVQSYLLGDDVWTDTGITPTQADLDAQQIGNLPPSLARDAVHLNDAANTAIVNHLVQPRLIALGWYQQGA